MTAVTRTQNPSMNHAKFIVFEGIDGSGKGTQVELVAERLRSEGKKVAILDFPRYKHQSGFMVSKYLNGEYGTLDQIGPELASTFYAIDRFDAKQEALAALAENDYVLANRYASSNMIFQASKLDSYPKIDTFLDWVYDLEFRIFGIPKPDTVVFLKISVETSARLVAMKEQRDYIKGGGNKDIHEANLNFLRKTSEIALYVASRFTNWKVLECENGQGDILPKEAVTDKILAAIR